MKKILVLTGGGPAPALNPTIAGICQRADPEKYEVIGGLRGWGSLAFPQGEFISLREYQESNFKRITLAQLGGSIIKTSRTKPSKVSGGMQMIQQRLEEHEIHAIIPIGGDDTLGFAEELARLGYSIVAAPKTIDNDLSSTFWTPGFPTAAQKLIEFTSGVVNHADTTENFHFIETFGGKAGWLTAAAYLGGAQVIVPPEQTVNIEELMQRILEIYKRDGYAVAAVSHEAKYDPQLPPLARGKKDLFGHERDYFQVVQLREMLMQRTDVEVRAEAPAYYLMGANPIKKDWRSAMAVGNLAMQLVEQEKWGYMAAISPDGKSAIPVPLSEAVGEYRRLTQQNFDFSSFSPKQSLLDYLKKVTI